MTETIKLTFRESIPINGRIYSSGQVLNLTVGQVFGSVTQRSTGPFDFFASPLFATIQYGMYRIARNITMELKGVSMKQSDTFYADPRISEQVIDASFVVDIRGNFVVNVSSKPLPKTAVSPTVVDTVNDIPAGSTGMFLIKNDPDKGGEALYLYQNGTRYWMAMVENTEEN